MQDETLSFTPDDFRETIERIIEMTKETEQLRIIHLLLDNRVIYPMADGSYGHNNLGAIQLKKIEGL